MAIKKPRFNKNEGLIYLDSEHRKESEVNPFLTCRDGVVEMIEFTNCSGYGAKCRLFRCSNTKHEVEALILQEYISHDNWLETVINLDSDSFKYLDILLGVKKDKNNEVILYRDYGNR
jgi:hypothetical protein